jgi:hypothetical protein
MAVDPSAAMDGTYFVSRTECLTWLNKELGLTGAQEYARVEQCASGFCYLTLAKRIFPKHTSAVAKGKPAAATEYDRLHNWKLLQDILYRSGLTRIVDIEKHAKGTYQVNLEFLQWFKRLYETRKGSVSPHAHSAAPAQASSPSALADLELERNYYFEKLIQIERLVLQQLPDDDASPTTHGNETETGNKELAAKIREILYRP